MKRVDKIERDAKTEIINYILKEYDKNFKKEFNKSEFEDILALNEIIQELKELKYIKANKNKFTISLLGIRHLREILFSRDQYIENIKIQWSSIILSVALALISNLIAIYSFDSKFVRILLTLFEVAIVIYVFKTIEKITKM